MPGHMGVGRNEAAHKVAKEHTLTFRKLCGQLWMYGGFQAGENVIVNYLRLCPIHEGGKKKE